MDDAGGGVRNSVGDAYGVVVQAGVINGGITFQVPPVVSGGPGVVPDEVPALRHRFVNRRAELERLGPGGGDGVRVWLVHGLGGIGKSALVSYSAELGRAGARYPGGQIYVDFDALRGVRGGADVSEAVRQCLASLGVADAVMPKTLAERVKWFRSMSASRRLLVVCENVTDAAHVRSLVPRGEGSGLLATSARLIPELGMDRVEFVGMSGLSVEAGVELLAEWCGADAVAGERAAAERLVEWCGGLPKALEVLAARFHGSRRVTLARLAGELADERGRLGVITDGRQGDSVSAVFDLAYEELPAGAARVYRLAGWLPGPSFDAGVVAAVAGVDADTAAELLDVLDGARLLEGTGDGRHRFHGLVRLHARARAEAEEPAGRRAEVVRAATVHYLVLTALADRAVRADRLRIADLREVLSAAPDPFGEIVPLDWLEAERRNILDVLRAASAEEGLAPLVWPLAEAFTVLFLHHRHLGAWRESLELGAAAAARCVEPAAEARLRSLLSRPLMDLGEYGAARAALETAAACAQVAGNVVLAASVQEFTGRYWDLHDPARAESAYRESIRLNEAGGEPRGVAIARYFLGCAQDARGAHAEALATLREARGELLARDDARMAARARLALGLAHWHLGEVADAERELTEAAGELRAREALHYEAAARIALADLGEEVGTDKTVVRSHLERALEIHRDAGSPEVAVVERRLREQA
ncbi:hypothetical protein OHS33_15310 [Streptomyces sp. NBC_00536]|uniref:hypothetical protein n=1 Tax=Streptomyces sp. NBC_00536 TaxID=2975769 RepID=UPI002E8008EB|nr:hypothetical protein [Streptomyces sp. NBC_00536]WUC79572.1 hypothetical protein OHS33_15310 [Streptomyces sp. NBC_00536]